MSSVLAQSGVQADDVGIFDSTILDQWEVPFGEWIDQMVDWIDANLSWLLEGEETGDGSIPGSLQK